VVIPWEFDHQGEKSTPVVLSYPRKLPQFIGGWQGPFPNRNGRKSYDFVVFIEFLKAYWTASNAVELPSGGPRVRNLEPCL